MRVREREREAQPQISCSQSFDNHSVDACSFHCVRRACVCCCCWWCGRVAAATRIGTMLLAISIFVPLSVSQFMSAVFVSHRISLYIKLV